MQENNNFETIISTWRRLSGEQIETAGVSMSGDSHDLKPAKKKEEETNLLMPEGSKMPIAMISSAGTAAASSSLEKFPMEKEENPEEKQEFIKRDRDDKEAAGDTNEKSFKNAKDDDYVDNDKVKNKSDKHDNDKNIDKVDSVYLRPPPPHKTRSDTSNVEQDDCGITCLYYTLQFCECVIM